MRNEPAFIHGEKTLRYVRKVIMTWKQDLAMGVKYQKVFVENVIECDRYEMPEGNFKPYDIKIWNDSDSYTVEVKSDRYAKRTGCIVIEFEYDSNPSGIATTEADFWAYFIDGTKEYFLIPTDVLRRAIKKKKYMRTLRGGDGMKSQLYLFSGSEFAEFRDCYE